jgi:tryptophan synthase alpha chain
MFEATPPSARENQLATGRIPKRFAALAERSELGIVAYMTAGDPTLGASEQIILSAAEAGADVIELGVPFSDPLADGPTIQRASERALRSGTTLAEVISLARRLREKTNVPLVMFSYYNPILQAGLERFAQEAVSAGIDGVLITDMTPEEACEYRTVMRSRGLDTIFLAAPTSTDDRLDLIAKTATGFLYLISRTGVTGTRDTLPDDLPALVRRVRAATNLPIAVGFGISLATHVSVLGGIADAAVVGSAIVERVEKSANAQAAASAVGELVQSLKQAARSAVSRRSSQQGSERGS